MHEYLGNVDRQLCIRADERRRALEDIAARLRAGAGPAPADVDREVERALECLMEAKMRLRALSVSAEDEAARLRAAVARLAEALVDVRMTRTGGELLTHGFVLPRDRRGA